MKNAASRRAAFGIGPSGPNFVSNGGSGSYGKCGSRKCTYAKKRRSRFAASHGGKACRNTSPRLPSVRKTSWNSTNPRSKPKPLPATAFATKPAVWTPWAERSSARVRRSFGRRAENETSLWCRSGYCEVQTEDMAPSV